ncbi:putative porin [Silvibacterium bohemicum]|uniref:Putative porin n=1 Tax=Silvibacterium bohemicum TaxID=1577686 RepID=A0A841K0U3_9BACT|nr:porin [Silvibacterium bohemicum]MBB6147020.1 putative porin [Silvibacterium bohemicum]
MPPKVIGCQCRFVAIVLVLLLALNAPSSALAQDQGSSTDDKKALLDRIDRLERALAAVQAQLNAMQGKPSASVVAAAPSVPAAAPAVNQPAAAPQEPATAQVAPPRVAPDTNPGSTTPSSAGVYPTAVANQTIGENQPTTAEQAQHRWFERKPGRDLSFYTHGGEITAYGNLDVSFDVVTKGIGGLRDSNGLGPVGNMGWLEDLSTNLSFVGVRGTQATGINNLNFIYQLETQIEISAAPGIQQSNSEEQNTVQGTLFTRNSYIGLGDKRWGAFLFGKSDAPYKQSTARLNPFVGMEGDNAVIMGNTGGDNRVEFGTRLDHSLWYSSPNLHGYEFNILFSPGQNRSNDSDNLAAGEPDCTGGDNPGDGADLPDACNDGSWSDAVSASVSYTKEPLYITAAYERHMKVNRQSDLTALYATPVPADYTGPVNYNSYNVPISYYNADVADEDAGKVGIQYGFFNKKTVVSAEVETLHRYVPYYLEFQNERQRLGSWLAFTQALSSADSLSIGWAAAYRTPGDPGQHNSSFVQAPLGFAGDLYGGRGVNNKSDMYTAVYRHRIGDGLTAYTNWAATFNDQFAHYDLGAGGHGVKTDGHDAFDAVGNEFSDPHLWAGGRLKGVSVGMEKRF